MPVKVRCSGCSKVLNAPEKARGKAIRCPDCQTVIRVPAQKKQVAKQAAVPPPPSSSSIIANLDLQKYEEHEHRICPRCGAEVSPEDIECPKCEVMLESGQLSDKKKKARARKGPDPALYYKSLIGDAWRFVADHKKIAFRTVTYSVLFSTIALVCFTTLIWCSGLPTKTFWGFLGFVVLMIPPGWAWFLHTTIIRTALENKKKLPKKIRFDFFLCSALGIKVIAWTLAMGIPLHAVALVFWMLGMPIWAASFSGFGLLFALLVFPIAMVHMTMPVTTPAWKFWVMDGQFFRNIPPVLYWVFFMVMTMLPALAVAGAGAFLGKEGIQTLIQVQNDNVRILDAKLRNEEISKSARGIRADDETKEWAAKTPVDPNWSVVIIPGLCWIGASGLFGFASVYNMRSNALFGIYFRHRLDLITMAEEIKYVPKPKVDLDDEEQAGEMTWKTAALTIAIVMAFACCGGVVYGMVGEGVGMLVGFLTGMYWGGAIVAGIGYLQILLIGAGDNILVRRLCRIIPFGAYVFVIMYWHEVKWWFVVNIVGFMIAFFAFVATIAAGLAFSLKGPQEAVEVLLPALRLFC